MDQWFNDVCGLSRHDLWLFDNPNQRNWWSDIDLVGRHSQNHIQRKNHAVLIVQTCVVVTGFVVKRDVMRAGMRVGDDVVVAVQTGRLVDVPHWRQRGYTNCQTEQYRQETMTHSAASYATRPSSRN
jgi:hypothetical protein